MVLYVVVLMDRWTPWTWVSKSLRVAYIVQTNPHTVFVTVQCFPSLPDCFKPTETLGGRFVCVVSLQWWECVQSSHFFLCVPIFLVFLYLCEMGALGLGGFCSEPGLTAGKLFFSPVELTRNNQALVFCFLSWKALYFYLFYLRLEHI